MKEPSAADNDIIQSVSNMEKNEGSVIESKSEEDEFAHLPEDEAAILRNQVKIDPSKISYFTLYRYATTTDKLLLAVAHFAAIASGAATPMYTLIFGNLTDKFTEFFLGTLSPHDFQNEINKKSLFFVYLGVASICLNFLQTYITITVAERLTGRIRRQYLKAILRQNIAYFDKLGPGEVTTRITNDINNIQLGIAEKATQIVSGISCFITSFVIGFAKDWKMTLILFSVVVAILLDMIGGSVFIMKYAQIATEMYSKGSTVAEECFASIRNMVAFGAQSRLLQAFDTHLLSTKAATSKRNTAETTMVAVIWGVVYFSYALGFWQGSRFIVQGDTSAGNLITVILAILVGSFIFAFVAPHFQYIGISLSSAAKIFETIDRVPPTDVFSEEGMILDEVKGSIELKNVKFIYPSRPEVTVLPNLSLVLNPGETVALVGASGSGKSTIIGIVERFYDVVKGEVLFDGNDITQLNLRWLRQQISLVSQEPTLFATTIEENILYGLVGTPMENTDSETKRNLVIEACKTANAYDFITALPDGLATHVGERGFLLSGGQKQRVAIARAIISQPKILLLDEATSALDTKSEGIVQEALERASKSRTTIVIAHRLSTIKDADRIIVMSKGEIVEAGTHDELLDRKGYYFDLVTAQNLATAANDDSNEDITEKAGLYENEEIPVSYSHNLAEAEKITTIKTNQSVSSRVLESQKNIYTKQQPKRSAVQAIKILLQMNTKKDNYKILVGLILALIAGFGYPALGIIFGEVLSVLITGPDHYSYMRERVNLLTGFLFMIGCVSIIIYFVLLTLVSDASVNLSRNIRHNVFRHYLRMDIAFFDQEENTSGALVSTLAKDAESVLALCGTSFCQVMQSLMIVFGGVIVGLAYSWKLSLVCFSCVPVLVSCGFLRYWVLTNLEQRGKKAYEKSGTYACESVGAIRTVASLTREQGVVDVYRHQIEVQVEGSRLVFLRSGILYGLAEGLIPLIMGLGFWYGSTLMRKKQLDTTAFFVVLVCIVFGANSAGNVFSHAGDMGKAKEAADNIANTLAIPCTLDPESKEGIILDSKDVEGAIEFSNVYFRYPTRPDIPVLKGLNLSVYKGQYIALVGASGCGKSTTIGLIERFYQPLSGSVLLDGKDIASLNLKEYRNQISLVQQEPTLYSGSIRENILFGLKVSFGDEDIEENKNESEMISLAHGRSAEELDRRMIEAARKANIHDFVMSLPEGYDTSVGSKGAMLSGGQKQRIAIARALIRDPKVLLLDEATSALDSESEKAVQAALDAAAKGRTTIAVAHRLSTIQNADIIYVFEKGRILESGTHSELLENKSKYYELVQMQRLQH